MIVRINALCVAAVLAAASFSGCTVQNLLPPAQTGDLYVLEDETMSLLAITPAADISVLVSFSDLLTFLGEPTDNLDFSNCGLVALPNGTMFFVVGSRRIWVPGDRTVIRRRALDSHR